MRPTANGETAGWMDGAQEIVVVVVVVVVVVRHRCAGAIIDAVAAYDKARPGQGATAWHEFYVDN